MSIPVGTAHSADRRSAALTHAVLTGEPSQLEVALGRFRGADAVAAAERAAAEALSARRWEALAFLADFLADVTAPHSPTGGDAGDADDDEIGDEGGDAGDDGGKTDDDEGAGCNCGCGCSGGGRGRPASTPRTPAEGSAPAIEKGILDYIVATERRPTEAPPEATAEPTRACALADILAYVEERRSQPGATKDTGVIKGAPLRAEPATARRQPRPLQPAAVVEFLVTDSDAPPGSAPDSESFILLDDPSEAIEDLQGADEEVVAKPTIRVLYSYPFGTAGPSAPEQEFGGWIFEEAAPNGRSFTRADLVRAVSARYHQIYAEEEATSAVAPQYIPGMLNRAPTNGKYQIWGHTLSDLALRSVAYDAAADLYALGIDS
jgi:hypothetical protein